jgi:hypothetical protein
VGFLLVGHMHSDIDQRFSSISHVLKGNDINSLSELLTLLQNQIPGHANEPVRYAQLMENIWDCKGFIIPHLQSSRSTEFIGMNEPHHFDSSSRTTYRTCSTKYMQMMHGGRVMVIHSWQVFQT